MFGAYSSSAPCRRPRPPRESFRDSANAVPDYKVLFDRSFRRHAHEYPVFGSPQYVTAPRPLAPRGRSIQRYYYFLFFSRFQEYDLRWSEDNLLTGHPRNPLESPHYDAIKQVGPLPRPVRLRSRSSGDSLSLCALPRSRPSSRSIPQTGRTSAVPTRANILASPRPLPV